MIKSSKSLGWYLPSITILLFLFLFKDTLSTFLNLKDLKYGYYPAIGNSTFLAALFSLTINLVSLLLGVFLVKIGFKKKQLAFLILTFFLGSLTASYTWSNVLFYQVSLFTENKFYLTLGILIIQFWKIGFILTYFYFFIIQDEISNIGSYIKSYKITQGEILKDFVLPKVEKPYLINTILLFVFTFFDTTISEKIFRVSRGQENQLINDWLRSLFDLYRISDSELAFKQLAFYSLLTMVVALLTGSLTTSASKILFSIYRKNIIYWKKKIISKQKKHNTPLRVVILIILLMTILYPLFQPIVKHGIEINAIPYDEILKMVAVTLACALFVVLLSLYVHFTILVKSKFHKKNNIRLTIFSFIFFLIPPVLIEKASYKLKSMFLFLDDSILWFGLQVFWTLPLVLLFSLPLLYSINKNSVKYDQIHRIKIWHSFNNNVLSPFSNSVLLLFFLITSIIWNDVIINSIFSDNLYSFASAFERVVNSRIVNYQTANFMLILSLIISIAAILIYTKAEKEVGFNKN